MAVSDGVAEDQAQVHITIVDINDQTPTFSHSVYTFSPVNETAKRGHAIGQVTAADDDVGDNSLIRYRITQGPEGL